MTEVANNPEADERGISLDIETLCENYATTPDNQTPYEGYRDYYPLGETPDGLIPVTGITFSRWSAEDTSGFAVILEVPGLNGDFTYRTSSERRYVASGMPIFSPEQQQIFMKSAKIALDYLKQLHAEGKIAK
jgi:hypothetical protein